MPETKKFQIIKGIPIFSSLTEKELREIESLFIEEAVKKDEYIFWEGDPSNWLYVVSEGKVRVLKQSTSGKDIILEIISSGDLFGGVAVLDKRPYPATAQAMENSKILKLSRSNILKILDSYPTVAIDTVAYMGKRLRDAHEMMRSLTVETAIRVMSKFAKKGLVDSHTKKIVITDKEGLETLLENK
jgi:CRP/FNR family transcriptional regulator